MARFTLLDDPYFSALKRVASAFDEAGIPFCLVGGGAVQAWIATLRTNEGAISLSEEPMLETALRKTRDLDFTTRSDEGTAIKLLNRIAADAPGTHVSGPRSARLGPVSVALTLHPDDLSGMAALYDRFLDSRTTVRLKQSGKIDEFPAIALEELVVTKITRRGDKTKDLVDIAQLAEALKASARSLDFSAIRSMLTGRSEALAILEDLERQWEET